MIKVHYKYAVWRQVGQGMVQSDRKEKKTSLQMRVLKTESF